MEASPGTLVLSNFKYLDLGVAASSIPGASSVFGVHCHTSIRTARGNVNVNRRVRALRIIVCGGRDYHDKDRLFAVLDELHAKTPIEVVVHGNAAGVDRLSGVWAHLRNVRCWPVAAEWSRFGKSAGPRRNQKMLGLRPAMVVTFPGGAGTADMVKRARKAGVRVMAVDEAISSTFSPSASRAAGPAR